MQKKDKNSEFLYFYFLNMSKKNLTVLFLLLSGVIAVLAYAGGKQSNWLSDSQINFAKDNLSTDRGNKLEAQLRDAVINGLTTRAQNHEKRLQAFAQSTGYPNLTPEQTSFSDLLSTKHSNQLTVDMRNGLLTRLTYAVTNHEMRLRALEKPTATPTKVDGKCGTAVASCSAGTVKWDNGQTACGTTRTWNCEGSNGWTTAYNCSFQNPACESYSCQGTYMWDCERVWRPNTKVVCLIFHENERKDRGEQFCSSNDASTSTRFPGTWWIEDPTVAMGKYTFCKGLSSSRRHEKPASCPYACKNKEKISPTFCEKKCSTKNCSSLSELACKAQVGCRWAKN